jgi:catechol 2,3-dioxygenase-like lactoylglutathione lyase family enzyme
VSVEVDSPATVDALHARAVDSGLRVEHPPTDEPWGVRRFFVRTPGGVVVNVVAHV